jgi:peptidoglycan/LPS O-acetylase OafA/YrhL
MIHFLTRQPTYEMTHNSENKYRNDIDGLRAISVLAVYFFHCGFLPNGYLGVDVFFAISGYLLTGILYRATTNKQLNLANFYLRRIRRIVPLSILVSAVSLALGYFTMLPDDLENLSQSVIATQLFANNVLLAITTRNYWDIANEFKPLMHTWSLGLEEQFYIAYPLLFLLFLRIGTRHAFTIIATLSLCSLIVGVLPGTSDAARFYYLPFRFWEISAGGLVAIFSNSSKAQTPSWLRTLALAVLVLTLTLSAAPAKSVLLQVSAVLSSLVLLAPESTHKDWTSNILSHAIPRFIGQTSYSIYMWHQVFLAFSRYTMTQHISMPLAIGLLAVIVILSYFSFRFVEQPFRHSTLIGTRSLMASVLCSSLALSTASFYIVSVSGVVRDVPELEVTASNAKPGQHIQYNERIQFLNRDFSRNGKTKVLVVGDSFARDWCNILLESAYKDQIDLTYAYSPEVSVNFSERLKEADVLFLATRSPPKTEPFEYAGKTIWVVGTKNFGTNSGFFFNQRTGAYFLQRTSPQEGVLELNERCKLEFGDHYIDVLAQLLDSNGTVPVFTPDGKFISQDTVHLTKAGATYLSALLQEEIGAILRNQSKSMR